MGGGGGGGSEVEGYYTQHPIIPPCPLTPLPYPPDHICRIHKCAPVQQQRHQLYVATCRCIMQGRPSVVLMTSSACGGGGECDGGREISHVRQTYHAIIRGRVALTYQSTPPPHTPNHTSYYTSIVFPTLRAAHHSSSCDDMGGDVERRPQRCARACCVGTGWGEQDRVVRRTGCRNHGSTTPVARRRPRTHDTRLDRQPAGYSKSSRSYLIIILEENPHHKNYEPRVSHVQKCPAAMPPLF